MNQSKMKKNCQLDTLRNFTDQLLEIGRYKDYCPNGLQVQGKQEIRKIVTGVTASKALIEAAIDAKADAIFVHHGWFWRNDEPAIVGQLFHRLKLLMNHDISLFAYHLPLDGHLKLGNNAQLANQLGWEVTGQALSNELLWLGRPSKSSITLEKLTADIEQQLNRKPLLIGDPARKVKKIAWCTGAAQGYLQQAIEEGVDVFISGEVSEPTFHLAQESGVAYIAAGHHATERYGINALGQALAKQFGIAHEFIDINNPV